jgi:hypothetical protein
MNVFTLYESGRDLFNEDGDQAYATHELAQAEADRRNDERWRAFQARLQKSYDVRVAQRAAQEAEHRALHAAGLRRTPWEETPSAKAPPPERVAGRRTDTWFVSDPIPVAYPPGGIAARARVAEFVRQFKLGTGQDPDIVMNVFKDAKADLAPLLVSDLEALL